MMMRKSMKYKDMTDEDVMMSMQEDSMRVE